MKTFIKLLLPISMIFVFTGCDNFPAEMKVQKTLTIQSHNLFSTRTVTYDPGNYSLKGDYNSIRGKIVLSSEGHEDVEFTFPKNYLDKPNFTLKGSEIGESFDIKARMDVDTTRGKTTETTEYCEVGNFWGLQSVIEHVEDYKYFFTVVFVDSASQTDLAVMSTFIKEDSRKIIDKYLEDCPADEAITYGNPHRAWPV
jgi:hypothetical protein